jgi:hypothetical protein
MNKHMARKATLALVAVATLSGIGIGQATAGGGTVRVRVPVCAEDETFLKGKGDFDGRRWDRYVCIHPDNLK